MVYTKKKARPANHKKYIVRLTAEERERLTKFVESKASKERRRRANILLWADIGEHGSGGWVDDLVAEVLNCTSRTVERTRKLFVNEGIDRVLEKKKQILPPRKRKLNGEAEARVIAIAQGPLPEGRARWTYRLLTDRIIELGIVESISHKSVWETLKKTNFSLI